MMSSFDDEDGLPLKQGKLSHKRPTVAAFTSRNCLPAASLMYGFEPRFHPAPAKLGLVHELLDAKAIYCPLFESLRPTALKGKNKFKMGGCHSLPGPCARTTMYDGREGYPHFDKQ